MDKPRIPDEWKLLKIFIEEVLPLELALEKAISENNEKKINRLDDVIETRLYRIQKLCQQDDELDNKLTTILGIGYGLLNLFGDIAQRKCNCSCKSETE